MLPQTACGLGRVYVRVKACSPALVDLLLMRDPTARRASVDGYAMHAGRLQASSFQMKFRNFKRRRNLWDA